MDGYGQVVGIVRRSAVILGKSAIQANDRTVFDRDGCHGFIGLAFAFISENSPIVFLLRLQTNAFYRGWNRINIICYILTESRRKRTVIFLEIKAGDFSAGIIPVTADVGPQLAGVLPLDDIAILNSEFRSTHVDKPLVPGNHPTRAIAVGKFA